MLVNNPGAGAGRTVGAEELLELLRAHGHRATPLSMEDDDWHDRLLGASVDLVAVAGGDGTLRTVLTALAGTDATVGVIATGTANNIAHTLGTAIDDPPAAIDAWDAASTVRYDVPLFHSEGGGPGDGHSRLVESLGGGVFARLIAVAEEQERRRGADGGTDDGLRLLRGVLRDAVADPWRVVLDGEDLSGEYLAVEAMNIARLGPNVELAPGAVPADGLIDLVLVREADRGELLGHVDHLLEVGTPGDPAEAPRLEVRRGADVRLVPPAGCELHVDDERWTAGVTPEGSSGQELRLVVDGTTLDVLVPSR